MQKIYDFKTIKQIGRFPGEGAEEERKAKYVQFVNIAILLFAQGQNLRILRAGSGKIAGKREKPDRKGHCASRKNIRSARNSVHARRTKRIKREIFLKKWK